MKNKKRIDIFSIILILVWSCILIISTLYNLDNITNKQEKLILEHAKNAFEKDYMFREWVAMHGGVYVFPTEKTPPNPYLKHIKKRDLITTTGEKLTLMNPAYTIRELMDNFQGMYGEKGHITSLKLLNPNNKPDEWETKILNKFDKKEFKETYEIYNYKGSEHLRYMKALVVKQECLKCHAQQGYKIGDIRGGISITIPMIKYNNDGYIEKERVIYLHLLIFIITLFIGYIVYKRILTILYNEEKIQQELKDKEKILLEQSKLASMGEMIGNIAHQWRQPLSVISTGATGIQLQKEYDMLTDQFLDETCDAINNNAQYLSKTIDDFKNFIKGNRKKEVFNLTNCINSFLHLVNGAIKNNNINIVLNLEEDIKVDGYENELIQCLINIFNNSKDAFKEQNIEQKLLFIDTFEKENIVTIKIRDNANGIKEDILPKIFEPYFTTKDQSLGTGLGLHMTYNLIVDGMQGTIEAKNVTFVYNDIEYTGAEFTIKLDKKI